MQNEITSEYLASQQLSFDFCKRFWERVKKTDSCWIWEGCVMKKGHGQINRGGGRHKLILTHRASWIINVGPIPEGMNVLHNCPGGDNPSCVNPAHLWLGTIADNNHDMMNKGRARFPFCAYAPKGEDHPNAKLTKEKAADIRRLYSCEGKTLKAISKLFGISISSVHRVTSGELWAT